MNPANDNSFFTPQRLMKIGVALLFDLVKFIFSILFLFAPLLGCIAGAAAAANYLGAGSWLQGAACAAGGLLVGAVEVFTGGVGAAAIQAAGEVFADAIDFAAWVLFSLWFLVSGTKFIGGGKRSMNRFSAGAGSVIIGALPFANIAPTITIGVTVIEWNQYMEDKEKAAKTSPADAWAQQLAAQQERLAALREASNDNQEESDWAA